MKQTEDKVLVVDDEPVVCASISRWLTHEGYSCRTAESAQDALAAAEADPPGLAIMDICMPGRDGIWLLRQYKERWPDMAIVMLTGVSEAQTAVECLRFGADDYLMKPVNMDALGIAARRAIEKRLLIVQNRDYQANLEKMVDQRTAELDKALQVIESTYQSTLEALAGAKRIVVASSGLNASRSKTLIAPSRPRPGHDETNELAVLRAAGELICKGRSTAVLAREVIAELANRPAVRFARLWTISSRPRGLETSVESGDCSDASQTLAVKAMADHSSRVERNEGNAQAAVPIMVRGRAEGVLQVGWSGGNGDPTALAERLALFTAVSLAREHDAEEWQKTAHELDIFYGMAGATRYSLDIHHVAQFIMDSLHKVVRYDVAGLLLLEEPASLRIQSRFHMDERFIARVREQIVNTLRLTCGVEVSGDLESRVSHVETSSGESNIPPGKLRSFVNVPLTIEGGVVGQIHVSSGQENAFSQEEILFLNRVANFLASAVQGVRDVLATVKGRIELMVDHMSDGVLMLDHLGKIVAMNEATRKILKLGTDSNGDVPYAVVCQSLGFDALALLREERRSIRRLVLIRDVPYQIQLSPVEHAPGQLSGAVVAFRDFTEEKKVDEMKSEFVSVVSHELRTPLTAMKNAVDLLLGPRLGGLNPNQERFLALAQRNIGQLRELINDLLDVSKIEAGRMHVSLRPLHLADPIETAVSSLRPQAEGKAIRLETSLAPELPQIHGDPGLIERVLLNLLGNALKFTDPGGTIRVEATMVPENDGAVLRPHVEVAVTDTGVGIPANQLESIFDKFHQVDREGERTVTGTGLGLPICRALVQAHHGRIWAESEMDKGSRFVFRLPVLSEEDVFFRSLEPDLERARKLPAPLALACIRLQDPQSLQKRLGSRSYASLLDALEASAQETVRRSTDRLELRRQHGELVGILLDTTRDGGLTWCLRLLERIRDAVTEFRAPVDFSCGCAVFPEEAATAQRLYRLAVERAVPPEKLGGLS